MKINNLTLRNFRNIAETNLSFSDHLNIFYGDNGQGKTNIVESIVYLSSARSFRVNDDKNLVRINQLFAEVKGTIINEKKSKILRSVISEQGKYFEVDHQNLNLMSDFIGHCNVVLFNPDDLNFFSASPKFRRREIDYEIGKMSKKYLTNLTLANKYLKERNAYLKNSQVDLDYLEVITIKLVEVSYEIMSIRSVFVDRISPLVNAYYQKLSGKSIPLSLHYESLLAKDNFTQEALLNIYKNNVQRDLDFKSTNQGFQREDFIFKIGDVLVSNVASQGQKRMIMIAYKLAVIDLFYKRTRSFPIFCLDDLFSELDEEKRDRVLNLLPESMQVFITTTDLSFVESKKNKTVFKVIEGNVFKEENNG